MLFDFELTPLNLIKPWGNKQNGFYLSWFGLTDGFYRIEAGNDHLLNYSPDFVKKTREDYAVAKTNETYVDYQVVRLWEDLLDMLPDILEPIPKKLASIIRLKKSDLSKWKELLEKKLHKLYNPYEADENFFEIVAWIGRRSLDTAYLKPRSNIDIWSENKTVYIHWDNKDIVSDSIPVWSAQSGEYELSKEDFINQVQKFNDDFISLTQDRVDYIVKFWDDKNVRIDKKHLIAEQADRSFWMKRSLDKPFQPLDKTMKILDYANICSV